MHDVINGNAPPKITHTFKINRHRHSHTLTCPRPRNNLYKSSFLYSGSNLWNNLPTNLKNILNKMHFKTKLKNYLMNKCMESGL